LGGDEFQNFMREVKEKAQHIARVPHFKSTYFQGNLRPMYVYDNTGIHVWANLQDIGIHAEDIVPQPAYSPDFNRPVEHVHNIITAKVQEWLGHERNVVQMPAALARIEDIFYSMDIAAIRKYIQGLPGLYAHVRKSEEEGGCAGGYALKKLR